MQVPSSEFNPFVIRSKIKYFVVYKKENELSLKNNLQDKILLTYFVKKKKTESMNDEPYSLKGYGIFPSEIVFDDDGLRIQRQLLSLLANIALSLFFMVSGTLNIISAINKERFDWTFYLQVSVTFLISVVFFVVFYFLIKYRKMNKKVYSYKDIKSFDTKQINTYINLTFNFTDHSTDKIKLHKNRKSNHFIDFLKTKTSASDN